MKFKDLFKKRSDTSSADTVTLGPDYPGTLVLSSSEIANPTLAMKIATAYRCTSILSGSIASLPIEIQRRRNGYFQIDEESELNYLLDISPNDRMTPFDFMRNMIIQVLNQGNAYIYSDISSMGRYTRLVLISPGCCSYDSYLNTYTINDFYNHVYGTFDAEDIIHIRGMNVDGGYTGESIIRYAARTLGLATKEAEQSEEVMQPGSTYKGFVSGDDSAVQGFGAPQTKQLQTVSDRIEKELKSGKNIMSLPGAMKFSALSMSPADLQLLDSKRFGVLEICRFYGVHPDKVFQNQSSNYKASDMAQVQYMIDTLQPYVRQIEQEFTRKLIPASMAKKMRIRFDLEEYYQLDFATKASYMKATIEGGVRTPNEWRAKDGKAPIKGGDMTFISCNLQSIENATAKPQPTATPTAGGTAAHKEPDGDEENDEEGKENGAEGKENEEKK
jgi:HK97 family phage portal protein